MVSFKHSLNSGLEMGASWVLRSTLRCHKCILPPSTPLPGPLTGFHTLPGIFLCGTVPIAGATLASSLCPACSQVLVGCPRGLVLLPRQQSCWLHAGRAAWGCTCDWLQRKVPGSAQNPVSGKAMKCICDGVGHMKQEAPIYSRHYYAARKRISLG